jgi:hypothetical protein
MIIVQPPNPPPSFCLHIVLHSYAYRIQMQIQSEHGVLYWNQKVASLINRSPGVVIHK